MRSGGMPVCSLLLSWHLKWQKSARGALPFWVTVYPYISVSLCNLWMFIQMWCTYGSPYSMSTIPMCCICLSYLVAHQKKSHIPIIFWKCCNCWFVWWRVLTHLQWAIFNKFRGFILENWKGFTVQYHPTRLSIPGSWVSAHQPLIQDLHYQ